MTKKGIVKMKSYDELWNALDPQECARAVDSKIYLARESYPLKKNIVESYDEFYSIVTQYMIHLEKNFLNTDVELPESMAFGKVLDLLRIQNLAPLYDRAKRGTEKGLRGVLEEISLRYCEEKNHMYTQHVLETAISDPWDYEEIESLITEYINRFGRYLPYQLRDKRLLVNSWRQILGNHAAILNKIRSMVGQI